MPQPHSPTPVDRSTVLSNIEADVEDNLSGLITAEDVRLRLRDIAVSFLNKADPADVSSQIDFAVDPDSFATRDVIRQFVEASTTNVFETRVGDNMADFVTYATDQRAVGERIFVRTTPGNPLRFNTVPTDDTFVGMVWQAVAGDDDRPDVLFDVATDWTLELGVGMRDFNYVFGGQNFSISSSGVGRPMITGGEMRNAGTYSGNTTLQLLFVVVDLVGMIDLSRDSPNSRTLELVSSTLRCMEVTCNDFILRPFSQFDIGTEVTVEGSVLVRGDLLITGSVMTVNGDLIVTGDITVDNGSVLIVNGNLSHEAASPGTAKVVVSDDSRLFVQGSADLLAMSVTGDSTVQLGKAFIDNLTIENSNNNVSIKTIPSGSTLSGQPEALVTLQGDNNTFIADVKNDVIRLNVISGTNNKICVGTLANGSTLVDSNNVFEFNGSTGSVLFTCSESKIVSASGCTLDMIGAQQNIIDCRGILAFTMDSTTQDNYITCYHFNGIINGDANTVHTSRFQNIFISGNNNSFIGNSGDSEIHINGNGNNVIAGDFSNTTGTIMVEGVENVLKINSLSQGGSLVYAEVLGTRCFVQIGSDLSGHYLNGSSSIFYNGSTIRLP